MRNVERVERVVARAPQTPVFDAVNDVDTLNGGVNWNALPSAGLLTTGSKTLLYTYPATQPGVAKSMTFFTSSAYFFPASASPAKTPRYVSGASA